MKYEDIKIGKYYFCTANIADSKFQRTEVGIVKIAQISREADNPFFVRDLSEYQGWVVQLKHLRPLSPIEEKELLLRSIK